MQGLGYLLQNCTYLTRVSFGRAFITRVQIKAMRPHPVSVWVNTDWSRDREDGRPVYDTAVVGIELG